MPNLAAGSTAEVCGHSLAGVAGANLAGSRRPVSSERCVLSGRGVCVELVARQRSSTERGASNGARL
jgi:hypothetical protein